MIQVIHHFECHDVSEPAERFSEGVQEGGFGGILDFFLECKVSVVLSLIYELIMFVHDS